MKNNIVTLTLVGVLLIFFINTVVYCSETTQSILWSQEREVLFGSPSFSPGGEYLAISAYDWPGNASSGRFLVLRSSTGEEVFSKRSERLDKVLFLPDSIHILYLHNQRYEIANIKTKQVERVFDGDNTDTLHDYYRQYNLSTDGKYLVTDITSSRLTNPVYRSDTVYIWSIETGKIIKRVNLGSESKYFNMNLLGVAYDNLRDRLWVELNTSVRLSPLDTERIVGWCYMSLSKPDTLTFSGYSHLYFHFNNNMITHCDDRSKTGLVVIDATTMREAYRLPVKYDTSDGNLNGPGRPQVSPSGEYLIVKNMLNQHNRWYEVWSLASKTCIDTLLFLPYGRDADDNYYAIDDSLKRFVTVARRYLYMYAVGEKPVNVLELSRRGIATVYPNPTNGKVSVVVPRSMLNDLHLSVSSLATGEIVRPKWCLIDDEDLVQIETLSLPNGAYFATVSGGGGVMAVKFVVNQ